MRQAFLKIVSSFTKEIKTSKSTAIPTMEGNDNTNTFIAALQHDLAYLANPSDRVTYLDEVSELLKAKKVQMTNRHYV